MKGLTVSRVGRKKRIAKTYNTGYDYDVLDEVSNLPDLFDTR